MKKTIISVTWIKNEADVIESSIRYALTHSDKILVDDNGSEDNTLEIIKNLQLEYPDKIILIMGEDSSTQPNQDDATNFLIQTAIEKHGADIVIPFDADEFLISPNGHNVRELLYNVDEHNCHLCKWRTYVWYKVKDNDSNFVPQSYTYYRNPAIIDEMAKVIICKEAWNKHNLSIAKGNHNVKSANNDYRSINQDELVFAHYPVRSKNQIAIKAVNAGQWRLSVDLTRVHGNGWHITNTYQQFKKNNFQITDDEMLNLSLIYSSNYKKHISSVNISSFIIDSEPDNLYPPIHCIYQIVPIDLFDTVLSLFCKICKLCKEENLSLSMSAIIEANEKIGSAHREKLYNELSDKDKHMFKVKVNIHRFKKTFPFIYDVISNTYHMISNLIHRLNK